MKRLIIIYGVLMLSVFVGVNMVHDAGYVLISYGNISIETSVWKACFLLVLTFLFFHYVLRTAAFIGSLNSRIRRWVTQKRTAKSHSLTMQGMLEFSEGKWRAAEKHLVKGAAKSENPVVNYLTAAKAAQELGAASRRDDYLKRAQTEVPSARVAVDLADARLKIASKQWAEAQTVLENLNTLEPSHAEVLKLLQQVYVEQKQWQKLMEIMPQLRRYQVLSIDECDKLEERVQIAILNAIEPGTDISEVTQAWLKLSYQMRKQPSVVACYARKLNELKRYDDAEHVLYQSLKRELQDESIEVYGLTEVADVTKQLRKAENWLESNPQNASLLLALARISTRAELWGKARTYYENAIALHESPAAYAELARLLEQLNEVDKAKEYYRKGLELAE